MVVVETDDLRLKLWGVNRKPCLEVDAEYQKPKWKQRQEERWDMTIWAFFLFFFLSFFFLFFFPSARPSVHSSEGSKPIFNSTF